jgi:hypothetical protein
MAHTFLSDKVRVAELQVQPCAPARLFATHLQTDVLAIVRLQDIVLIPSKHLQSTVPSTILYVVCSED